MPEEIKPCPFCNSDSTQLSIENSSNPDAQTIQVFCHNCFAQGPEQFTRHLAIKLWNEANKK
jgi:Lar family restriction alleviation protein